MNSRDRVIRQARGEEVDHVPLVGGWFHIVWNPANLASRKELCGDIVVVPSY